jgi:hypothetical protein
MVYGGLQSITVNPVRIPADADNYIFNATLEALVINHNHYVEILEAYTEVINMARDPNVAIANPVALRNSILSYYTALVNMHASIEASHRILIEHMGNGLWIPNIPNIDYTIGLLPFDVENPNASYTTNWIGGAIHGTGITRAYERLREALEILDNLIANSI